ncbi:alpha/beta fold hydrolase [Streptomyces sp. HUAS MG47]|uniref:alpha/beta fold hydrolase n=1 Tax=Streptomyces solicamelliae TaxID=3231716 RepID=UPI0038781059
MGGDAPPDRVAAEWALLLTDPLCEVRVLAEVGWDSASGFAMPGVRPAGAEVLELLGKLPPEPDEGDEVGALLRDTGLYERFGAAIEDVARSEEADRAALNATEDSHARELATALARAVVAAVLAAAGGDADCTGDERDRLVELLTARLGGDARMPGGRAAAVLGRLAMRVTTQPVLNAWRGSLTTGATPFVGDILRYQARGAALRDFLRERIAEEPGPTVLIGHSLGGIALVDLLALRSAEGAPLSDVRLLVTVGSQAPFLYEMGALTGLAPGEALPEGFPRWLNIFDRQDLLAFLAEPVFPDDPRVTDHEVSSKQPFLPCHSAYFKLGTVYDRIARAVAETG